MKHNLLLGLLLLSLSIMPLSAQVVFQEGFENAKPGSFPSRWRLVYAGKGTSYQYIDNKNPASGTNCLHLQGGTCYSCNIDIPISLPQKFRLSGQLKVNSISNYCGGVNSAALLALWNPTASAWGAEYSASVITDNGLVSASLKTGLVVTASISIPVKTGVWQQVDLFVDQDNHVAYGRINGEISAGPWPYHPSPGQPTGITLSAGHGYYPEAWFDDILVECWNQVPASISEQPVSQTVPLGGVATFSVKATGDPLPSYQWYLNTNLISGATNSLLIVSNVNPSRVGDYSVIVTNFAGGETSAPAALHLKGVMAYVGDTLLQGSNTFEGGVTVRMETSFESGTIFYTLNGDEPNYDSTPYSGPFVVSRSCRLRAVAYDKTFTQADEMAPVSITILPLLAFLATTDGGGTVTLDPPGGAYLRNTVVTVNAAAFDGWTFMGWMGDSLSNETNMVFTMTNNHVLQAIFGTTLSTLVTGNGSAEVDPHPALYPCGTTVRLSAVPAQGNSFVTWGGSGNGTNNPVYFAVTSPTPTVTCLFAPLASNKCTLTVVPQGLGRVNLSPRGNRFTHGQSVTLTATPDSGQVFLGWSGDLVETNNPVALTMNTNLIIEALFTSLPTLQPDAVNANAAKEGCRLLLKSEFGTRVMLTGSSNLMHWTTLLTVTNNYGTMRICDETSIETPLRFYRLLVE